MTPTWKKIIFISLAVVAGLAVIVWATYLYFVTAVVKVTNISGQPLPDVRVRFGEQLGWRGYLDIDESEWAFGEPRSEGAYVVIYEVEGQQVRAECGYVGGVADRMYLLLDKQRVFMTGPSPTGGADDRIPC